MAILVGPGLPPRGRGGLTRTKALVAVVAVPLVAVLLASVIAGQAEEGSAKRQSFGGGSVAVVAPFGVTDVAWVLDGSDSSKVESVELTFAGDLAEDSFVCAQVTNGTLPPLANGCTALTSTLPAGTPVPIPFTVPPDRLDSTTASAAAITGVSVTVIQPVVGVAAPNGVQVTEVDWTLLGTDITKVEKVKVTFAKTTAGPGISVRLTLKDPAGVVLLRETRSHTLSSSDPKTLEWILSSAVSAQGIARLDIQVRLVE